MKSQLNKKRNEVLTMKTKISNSERELAAMTAASQHAPKTRNATDADSEPNSPSVNQDDAPNSDPAPVDHHHPDLLIIGNLKIAQIKSDKIYRNKSIKVIMLQNKTIQGAMEYIQSSDINPLVIIL